MELKKLKDCKGGSIVILWKDSTSYYLVINEGAYNKRLVSLNNHSTSESFHLQTFNNYDKIIFVVGELPTIGSENKQ